jgi:hypothetical protein
MKRALLFAAACLLSLRATACAVPDQLAARYGITFSGFAKPLPLSADPNTHAGGPYLRLHVRDKANVHDGFEHTVLVDMTAKKAWILRTGGFISVYQWYGPVDVADVPLDGCRAAPPAEAPAPRTGAKPTVTLVRTGNAT